MKAPHVLLALLIAHLALPAPAETLVAARTIRSQTILMPEDLSVLDAVTPGALQLPEEAVGLEARVVLYAGRPIRPEDVGEPAVIERNEIVPVVFQTGGLTIHTEGRSLGRAGVGDTLRVMNLDSRTTVSGHVLSDGRVKVGASTAFGN